MKFKPNQEECWSCKVQNGKYKNHVHNAAYYIPLGEDDTSYYEAYNYLFIFDDYDKYNVDFYDYYDYLDYDSKCASLDCAQTSTSLLCDIECYQPNVPHDVLFYLNTVENAFLRLFIEWDISANGEDSFSTPNIYIGTSQGYPVTPIKNPYLKQCVEDCSDDGPWQDPARLTRFSECVCQSGYFQLPDGSCFDCTLLDPDCQSCNSTNCFQCNTLYQYVDGVEGKWCHERVENCIVDFESQPQNFVKVSDLFPEYSGDLVDKLICPKCSEGFTFNPSATDDEDFLCHECSSFIPDCTFCESGTQCSICDDGFYVSYDKTECLEQFEFCFIQPQFYANNGTHFYCQQCNDGFYFDFETMECEQCYDGCWTCSDYEVCTECYEDEDIIYPDGTCDSPLEGCAQDPETYRIVDGKYVCDQCELLKVFWPEIEACVDCNDAMPNCASCTDLTLCDECLPGFWLNADNNKCWTPAQFFTYYSNYINEGCAGDAPEDFLLVVDDEDEFTDEFFYACNECLAGYWLEDLTCYDCQAGNPLCVECEDGETCTKCQTGYIHEYNYWNVEYENQCIPLFENCNVTDA